ncbi:hypothetical protein [Piscirickettsia salmonis]|nr:hypothetical protein [Piscirickettsia salmonis]
MGVNSLLGVALHMTEGALNKNQYHIIRSNCDRTLFYPVYFVALLAFFH